MHLHWKVVKVPKIKNGKSTFQWHFLQGKVKSHISNRCSILIFPFFNILELPSINWLNKKALSSDVDHSLGRKIRHLLMTSTDDTELRRHCQKCLTGWLQKTRWIKPKAWSNKNGMRHYRKAAGVGKRAGERREWLPHTARLLLAKSMFRYSQYVTKGQILNTQLSFIL